MQRVRIAMAAGLAGIVLAVVALASGGEARPMKEEPDEPAEAPGELPFAQGREFATLDAYLAHLEKRGAYGVPWYREISPGVYELVSRRGPGAKPVRLTRAELMQRFGFTR